MNLEDYKCPFSMNGYEHREYGSGWTYGTKEGGRGNGNSYYRMTIFPGVSKTYNTNLIFKWN